MANDRLAPPLIKPDGRFSRIRLSEGSSTAGFAPAVTVDITAPESLWELLSKLPWPSPDPLPSRLTRTQVPRLRSPSVLLSDGSSLLRRTPTTPAAFAGSVVWPPCPTSCVSDAPLEFSRLTLSALAVLSPSLTPPRCCGPQVTVGVLRMAAFAHSAGARLSVRIIGAHWMRFTVVATGQFSLRRAFGFGLAASSLTQLSVVNSLIRPAGLSPAWQPASPAHAGKMQ